MSAPPGLPERPRISGPHSPGPAKGESASSGRNSFRPSGSGRSDHLRHTVSVSRARLRQNPLSDSRAPTGWILQPGRPREPSSTPTPAWPQPVAPRPRFPAGSRLKPPRIPGPPKRGANVCRATSGQKRRRTAEPILFTHKMLPAGAPQRRSGNARPARSAGVGTRPA